MWGSCLRAVSRAALALAVLLGGGCDDRCGPDGQWTDITTRRGTHDGYEVAACDSAEVSVLGKGSRWAADLAPGAAGRSQAFLDFADLVAVGLIVEERVFVEPGPRAGCTNPEAVLIKLSSWFDVDLTVLTVGELLRKSSLREEVLIRIEPICRESTGYW